MGRMGITFQHKENKAWGSKIKYGEFSGYDME